MTTSLKIRVNGLCAALLALPLVLSGCAAPETPAPTSTPTVSVDEAFAARVQEMCGSPDSFPLTTMTEWEWDRVSIFEDGATATDINREVGEPVVAETLVAPDSVLLVFQLTGHVARAITADNLQLRSGGTSRSFTDDVLLAPVQEGGGCPRLLISPERAA
ncbi:hypothetical protein [Klugiella xanthotipulae]|uniref:hypothetical protein n=1 Tax=Klugiella xanthotipulae TaxID=244735 RepID=UPI0011526FEF|nr:hypothetical protein [Klugiella xanthotipulae]